MNKRHQTFLQTAFRAGLFFFCLLAGLVAKAERIRLMGANITSGNYQSYGEGPGLRIFKGVKPDIVMIQEFKYDQNTTTAEIDAFVSTTFGSGFTYFREGNTGIPNGIISRYPILAAGEWDDTQVSDRDFVWARIDIPGPNDLWAVSVHLLTSSASVRNTEAAALVNFIQRNVPPTDYLVIGGDFNSDSRSEAQFTTFGAVVNTAGPHPADQNGNQNTNASRAKPYDSVFANSLLNHFQTPVVIGNSTYPNGLVVDTRVYTPLPEISPALSSDSAAFQMQHMAVVKDFMIPGDPPVIATASPFPRGTVGTALSRSLAATGGTAPYTWSLTSGTVPTGLNLGSTGVLSGTPLVAGTFTFTAKVTDASTAAASKAFTIVITPALAITSASTLPGGATGSGYSQTLAASGGTAPYSWTVSAGALPSGLTLGSAGALSGTPTSAGTFQFTARVADNAGANVTKAMSLNIISSLAVDPATLADGIVGTSYLHSFTASGGISPYQWAVTAGEIPAGLGLSPEGILSGTPVKAGGFQFTVQATDGYGAMASASFSMVSREPLTLFLESHGLAADAVTVDSDDDGIPNLMEFLLDGNPVMPDPAVLPQLVFHTEPATVSYGFAVRTATGSVSWKVQESTGLGSWTDVVSGENGAVITTTPGETMEGVTVTLPVSDESSFLRLVVTGP